MNEREFIEAHHKMLNGTIFTFRNATSITHKPGFCVFAAKELSEKSASNWHFSTLSRQFGPIGTTNQWLTCSGTALAPIMCLETRRYVDDRAEISRKRTNDP